jgi:hypothetical protein
MPVHHLFLTVTFLYTRRKHSQRSHVSNSMTAGNKLLSKYRGNRIEDICIKRERDYNPRYGVPGIDCSIFRRSLHVRGSTIHPETNDRHPRHILRIKPRALYNDILYRHPSLRRFRRDCVKKKGERYEKRGLSSGINGQTGCEKSGIRDQTVLRPEHLQDQSLDRGRSIQSPNAKRASHRRDATKPEYRRPTDSRRIIAAREIIVADRPADRRAYAEEHPLHRHQGRNQFQRTFRQDRKSPDRHVRSYGGNRKGFDKRKDQGRAGSRTSGGKDTWQTERYPRTIQTRRQGRSDLRFTKKGRQSSQPRENVRQQLVKYGPLCPHQTVKWQQEDIRRLIYA